MSVIWLDESNELNLAMICYSNTTVPFTNRELIYLVRIVSKSSSRVLQLVL